MGRISVFIGILVVALITTGLSDAPRQWLSPKTIIVTKIPTNIPGQEEPIPAYSTEPQVTIPQWSLYVGTALCLLIAMVMLCRCHIAEVYRWFRRPPPWSG